MKNLLYFILIGFATQSYAQKELNIKSVAIPAVKAKLNTPKTAKFDSNFPAIVAPNIFAKSYSFNPKPVAKSQYQIGTTKPFSMIKDDKQFASLGDVYKEKMNLDLYKTLHEGDAPLVRKNLYFGDYHTKSKYLIIKFRDFGQIDGDIVNVYWNDKIVESNIVLNETFREVKIILNEGFNKIDFYAVNKGSLGGNTAEFEVFDDKNYMIFGDRWYDLDAGFKAATIIIKD